MAPEVLFGSGERVLTVELVGVFRPAGRPLFGFQFHPPFNPTFFEQLGIAIAVAAGACDTTAIEILHPVAVEPGTEYAFAFVHISVNRIAQLHAIVRHRHSDLYFRWLKRNVNAGDCGHSVAFGYRRDQLPAFFPKGEELHPIRGFPRTELTSLKGAGVLINLRQ